jgi:large subunit ribosomal protein L6e
MSAKPQSKKFGKSTREVPASTERAQKWYNADDEPELKKVSVQARPGIAMQLCCFIPTVMDRNEMEWACWKA